jgi:hypothetical protein
MFDMMVWPFREQEYASNLKKEEDSLFYGSWRGAS